LEDLIMKRETIRIEGGRNLYNYTFREADDLDRLIAMIEAGAVGVIGPFLDQHPGLDTAPALVLAMELGNQGAVREIEGHRRASGST
jgi:hypothetical protein